MASSPLALLVDFGSTYTKVICVDLDDETVVARAQAVSTVESHLLDGLNRALAALYAHPEFGGRQPDFQYRIACSSAAGGLRMAVVGLIPSLTLEAARQAAFGAGAKIVGSYHHRLTTADIRRIEADRCDMVLLSGGTDGGNRDCILANAAALAKSSVMAPIVVAGNREAGDEAQGILLAGCKEVSITENVLPTTGEMNVEPVRAMIRDLFVRRIVAAKGLKEAVDHLGGERVMPTPMAVLKGAELLAAGTGGERGLGELMVVDVGGATTDVHSVAKGFPTRSDVIQKGVPPPVSQRTVEGDLGIRYNAGHIVDQVGKARFLETARKLLPAWNLSAEEVEEKVLRLHGKVGAIPGGQDDRLLDAMLARMAVAEAVGRHAACLKPVYTPSGQVFIQEGKDLSQVGTVIGVGGIFAHGPDSDFVLQGAVFDTANPLLLKPARPQLRIDRNYLLYAVGLLSEIAPAQALRIAKRYLVPPESGELGTEA
jgi:uncharacterized protein (TIGR01319 family)